MVCCWDWRCCVISRGHKEKKSTSMQGIEIDISGADKQMFIDKKRSRIFCSTGTATGKLVSGFDCGQWKRS
jgi:hypothetical protein